MLQLSQLEAFLAVAREQSFSRAAEKLYITQPSLTARIQALEKELGQVLFTRGRTTQLTAAGKKLLPYIEQALSLIEEGCHAINNAAGPVTSISVASTPIISSYCLPHFLKYLRANTNLEVSLRTGTSPEVVHLVESGIVDAAFANANFVKVHRHVSLVPITEDDVVLVASPRHPVVVQGSVSRRALRKLPIVAYIRDSAFWRPVEAFLTSPAVPHPNIILELDNFEAIKTLVMQGMGVAFVPRLALGRELKEGTLVEVRINPPVDFHRYISLFYLRSREENYGIRTLVAAMQSYLNTNAAVFHTGVVTAGDEAGQEIYG
ncbi:MAG: LysR family transcriptional regulator [Clostridia bacterium]|nr:MAG: LysR family transcriptional regulator [Clostridia bacterium]